MTGNSNPIINILKDIALEAASYWDGGSSRSTSDDDLEREFDKALLALYEAVKGCVPGPAKPKTDYDKGWNDSGEAFLTNLSLLFGVADVGNLDKPEATNSQPQLADNSSEVA